MQRGKLKHQGADSKDKHQILFLATSHLPGPPPPLPPSHPQGPPASRKEPGRRGAALTSRTAHTSRAAVIAVQVVIVQTLPLAVVGPLWAQLLWGIPWGREAEMLLVRSPWRVIAAGVRAGPASEGGE